MRARIRTRVGRTELRRHGPDKVCPVRDGSETRRSITVLAVVLAVAIGIAMAYLGFMLASFGVYAFSEGESLLGVLAMIVGAALFSVPVAVLVSQIRSMFRRRG